MHILDRHIEIELTSFRCLLISLQPSNVRQNEVKDIAQDEIFRKLQSYNFKPVSYQTLLRGKPVLRMLGKSWFYLFCSCFLFVETKTQNLFLCV